MDEETAHLSELDAVFADGGGTIGAFLRDRFIRPYVGDMLVTVLLCCLCRCIRPQGTGWLPLWVFFFGVVVECVQLVPIPALEGTLLGVLLGTTFDWRDILCYGVGCLVFWLVERHRWSVKFLLRKSEVVA